MTLEEFIAELYDANVFHNCKSRSDVEAIFEKDIDIEFEKEKAINAAWKYIEDRLPIDEK